MSTYLPSKKFLYRTVAIVILIALLFGIYKLSIFFINKFSKKGQSSLTISSDGNIQKDSNNNGIPDWEETLWGLDPTKDGQANKVTIEQRKAALAQNADTANSSDIKNTSSSADLVSQEFFAAVMSLQASGNLNDQSLQAIADAVGQKVVAVPIKDSFKPVDVKTEEVTDKNVAIYFTAMKNIFVKYKNKNIGDELTFISQGIQNNNPNAMKVAAGVAASYRAFGNEVIKIAVPIVIAQNHLDLANNYVKVGESIDNMTKELTDPILSMQGLISYKKYNDLLVLEIKYLSGILSLR
jgi:hypothetical protein